MPLLRPRTTLQQVDLTDWTPNWDDDDDAAPSTGNLKESDLEIHGTEETKLDDASAVDDTVAANQAPDANTSLDGGSPPLLSSPDSTNPLEGDAPPLSDTAILNSGASLEYAAGPTIGRTPATTTVDPMAKLNAAISLHLAELDRQRIAISKKYEVFHDLLVQTRTDFNVSAIKARVSSAVAVHTAPLAELVSQAEATIEHRAITAVDTAMTAAIAHGGLMEQRINDEVKLAVRAAINNIVNREIQPLVQDTVDNIFISYRDCVLTEWQQAKLDIMAHRTSVESAFHAAVDDTIYEFQQVVDTTTSDNMAMIDNAIPTANDAFNAKRASIVKSIKAAHRAAGTPHMPLAPSPRTSSEDNPWLSMLPSQPINLEILAEQNTPLGASKVGWTNVGRRNTDQPGDDKPCNSQLGLKAPPPTHQPPTSFSPPKSPAQPPAREHAQHGRHIQVYPNALFGHPPSTATGHPTPGAPIIPAGLRPTTPTHPTLPWAHARATTRTPCAMGVHVTPTIGPPTHLSPATKLPAPPALAAHTAPTPPWSITAVTLASPTTATCLHNFSWTLTSRTPTSRTKSCVSSATFNKAGTTDNTTALVHRKSPS
jgi:hypothetical protein